MDQAADSLPTDHQTEAGAAPLGDTGDTGDTGATADTADTGSGSGRRSIVIINTGDGKGKSSSAFGVMGRAWARGWRTCVIQCVKSGDWHTGEQKLAVHLGIEWHAMGDGFTWESDDLEKTAELGRGAWERGRAALASGDYDLVILDELTYTMHFGWVPVDDVVRGVAGRHPRTNVVITGRNAPAELIGIADTVTDMQMVKHAYQQGIRARRGLEF